MSNDEIVQWMQEQWRKSHKIISENCDSVDLGILVDFHRGRKSLAQDMLFAMVADWTDDDDDDDDDDDGDNDEWSDWVI